MDNNWKDLEDKYNKAVLNFLERYEESVSEHIIDVMKSVMMTRDKVQEGGSFVQAVVDNNLYQAISRADKHCINNLRIITACANHCYI
jgi:hypothetical protein